MTSLRPVVALALVLVWALAAPVAAQTLSGTIVGEVKDSSGASLPGATVLLDQPDTGFQKTQVTTGSGDYIFTFVPPGAYTVTVTMSGFNSVKRPVTLQAAATIRSDFALGVAGMAEDVLVEAAPPVVRTENAELGEVINQARIASVPLNGRRFADLVLLNAGAGVSTSGTSDTPLLQTGPNLNINGARPTHNSYSIDGVTATDYYFSNLSASTSVDAIQEFRIASGQYGAEFGGKGGGHVHVVTKSGSNEWRGSAFDFLRDDAFDSRNHFAPKDGEKPPFRQNQFGGSLGGPVVRNRLFFFANYEGLRTDETITKLATVPTAAMRAGNFAGLSPIYDPATTAGNGSRSPFPGNRIPTERLDPAALVLLETIPLPNRDGIVNNHLGQGLRNRDDNQLNLRLDYGTARGDRLFARFSLNEIDALEPFGSRGNNTLPGFASNVSTSSRNGALNYTRSLSPRHVMNVLLGLNRVSGGIDTTNQELDIARRAGLLVIADGPDELRGVPAVNTTFTSAFGDDTSTLLRTNTTYQAAVQFNLATGSHALTYGFEVMRHHFEPYTAIFARGSYTYSGRYTASTATGSNGNGFADFMLGIPFSGSALSGNAIERARSTWYGFYVQDNWRPTPKLTLNLGLRYDLMPPFYDEDNRLAAIDVDGRQVVVSSSDGQVGDGADPDKYARNYPLPFVSSEQAGWPRSLVDTDWTNIGPRLGVAYSVSPTFVVRGGYSIAYSIPPLNLQARMDRNPPFSGLLSPSNTVAPSFTTQTAFADAAAPPSFGFLRRDFRNTRVHQWSIGVDKELGRFGLSAAYVGTKSDFLDWFGTGNPATPCVAPCAVLEQRRVYPGLGGFTYSSNDARARYDGLQLRLDQKPWNGLRSVASFTWSKSLDNSSSSSGDDNSVANDPFDLDADWGPSSYDRRLAFVLSYGYKLPFGRGERWLNDGGIGAAILGGWELAGVVTAKSGDHFSVSIATCPSNSGGACRTDMTGDPNLPSGERTETRWFDTTVFRASPAGEFGDQGRNVLVGPGYFSWDFLAHKTFSLAARHQLQLRVEVFNLTNHVNYGRPDNRFGAASFGAISVAGPARQMQFGARYSF
jgi:outer membrane receptor protein involved in Fe transport